MPYDGDFKAGALVRKLETAALNPENRGGIDRE
jgi:hypothetical protein